MVREGSFREDLYYRLDVITLRLPTLHERREDVMLLASQFLRNAAREYSRPASGFSINAAQKLKAYEWPGNVRELENTVRQAVVMSDRDLIRAHELILTSNLASTGTHRKESFKTAKGRIVQTFEREYLNDLLSACGGNISQAAREAKKDRRAFFALLKKHSIPTPYSAQSLEAYEPESAS
jgi:two-component system response regulator GlrR